MSASCSSPQPVTGPSQLPGDINKNKKILGIVLIILGIVIALGGVALVLCTQNPAYLALFITGCIIALSTLLATGARIVDDEGY